MRTQDPVAFIVDNTVIAAPPLTPELPLHLATQVTPLWEATEANLQQNNLPPPYWAFAWPGGQAVARFILDHPEIVAGKTVLDFAAGSGLVALAAAKAGAVRVVAAEIDRFAVEAIHLNARRLDLTVEVLSNDIVGQPLEGALAGVDIVLAGDICYEKPMAERVMCWFRLLAARGITVMMGDPGRTYLPKSGLTARGHYTVPTSLDLEDRTQRATTVWQVDR